MLCSQRDFCNIVFKIKRKLYIASGSAPPPPNEKFWIYMTSHVTLCRPFVMFHFSSVRILFKCRPDSTGPITKRARIHKHQTILPTKERRKGKRRGYLIVTKRFITVAVHQNTKMCDVWPNVVGYYQICLNAFVASLGVLRHLFVWHMPLLFILPTNNFGWKKNLRDLSKIKQE
jgi:hypothetical protein